MHSPCTRWTILLAAALMVAAASAPADDAVVGNGGVASCSEATLDAALAQLYPGANFLGGNLTFNCGPLPATIQLTSRKTLTGATIVDGGGRVTLDGQDGTGIFAITGAESQVEIRNITLRRGRAFASNGGAIDIGDGVNLRVADSFLHDATADGSGGAIHVAPNSGLRIERSTFSGNRAGHGGAIASNSPVTVLDSQFSDNRATAVDGEGGALQIWFGRLEARRTQFIRNLADQGGALALRGHGDDYTLLVGSEFRGNRAFADGGAILLYDGAVAGGAAVSFLGNRAASGAALSLRGAATGAGSPRSIRNGALFTDCRFEDNEADSAGGAAWVFGPSPGLGGDIGQLLMDRCTVIGNRAVSGGAIYSRGQVLLDDTRFERNSASLGGALTLQSTYAIGDTDFTAYTQLRDLVFRSNSATVAGGAIYASSHLPIYESVQFEGNSSVQGGALYQQGFTPPITAASFVNNLASDAGGAIYARNTGSIQLHNLVFSGNQAYDVGGQGGDLAIESTGTPGTLTSQVQLSHATLLDGVGDSGAALYIVDAQSDLSIRNSLVFGSSGLTCGGPGAILPAGWNFMPADCGPMQATDVTPASRAALQLHPLSNNIGSFAAFVPMAGSPVIDHADCTSGRTTDARGQPTPVDGDGDLDARCDSGAIERQQAEAPPAFILFADAFEALAD
jgi:predicted outer membrane repeat protein